MSEHRLPPPLGFYSDEGSLGHTLCFQRFTFLTKLLKKCYEFLFPRVAPNNRFGYCFIVIILLLFFFWSTVQFTRLFVSLEQKCFVRIRETLWRYYWYQWRVGPIRIITRACFTPQSGNCAKPTHDRLICRVIPQFSYWFFYCYFFCFYRHRSCHNNWKAIILLRFIPSPPESRLFWLVPLIVV